MSGHGLAVGVAHHLGVAVVGRDHEHGSGARRPVTLPHLVDRCDDLAETGVDRRGASTVASQTPVWPTMSGLAKFAMIRS